MQSTNVKLKYEFTLKNELQRFLTLTPFKSVGEVISLGIKFTELILNGFLKSFNYTHVSLIITSFIAIHL